MKTPNWRTATIAITGMSNRPDSPDAGHAVARCLRAAPGFSGRIVGLGYDALDGGLYHGDICDAAYLLPSPCAGEASLRARLEDIIVREGVQIIIPCCAAELEVLSRAQARLRQRGVLVMLPDADLLASLHSPRLAEVCAQAHMKLAQAGAPALRGETFYVAAVGTGTGDVAGLTIMSRRAIGSNGRAWAGVTVDDADVEARVRKLLGLMAWPGPCQLEVCRDAAGRMQLVSIRAYFPDWIVLSHGAGCNLPFTLLRRLCGETINAPRARAGMLFMRYAEELVVDASCFESIVMTGRLLNVGAEQAA